MIENIKMHDNQFLTVDVHGTGKTVVILVHGIGGSSATWLPFVFQHINNFKFVSLNLRGFGKSHKVAFSCPDDVLDDYSNDLNSIISHYSPNHKVILVGLSLGAYSCMSYFSKFGTEKVKKYLNVDQCPKAINSVDWKYGLGGSRHKKIFGKFEVLMDRYNNKLGVPFELLSNTLQSEFLNGIGEFGELAFHRKIEQWAVNSFFSSLPTRMFAKQTMHATTWQSYYHCLKSYLKQDYDFRELIASIDVPITLHIGKFSKMCPPAGQYYIAQHAKHCNVVEFDEGHALMYTALFKFSLEFAEFLYN